VTRGQLPQRAGSLGLNGGGTATAVPPPWASECPDVKNCKWWLNPVWHRMIYSCTHMATVGVKGFMTPEIIWSGLVATAGEKQLSSNIWGL